MENETFHGSATREAQVNGSTASLSFSGDAVSVYGTTGPGHGIFSIQIDSNTPQILNGSASTLHPQTLLFFSGGLGHGEHSVVLTNHENAIFDLDFVTSASWVVPVSFPTSLKHLSTANIPVVAGVLSGAVVLVFWSIAVFLWGRRQHRKRRGLRTRASKEIQPMQDLIIPPDPAVVEGVYQPGHHLFTDKKAQARARKSHDYPRQHSDGQKSVAGGESSKSRVSEEPPVWDFDDHPPRPSTSASTHPLRN